MFHKPYPENGTDEDKKEWADNELRIVCNLLTMIEEGLIVSFQGILYLLPLCHDTFGEGNA